MKLHLITCCIAALVVPAVRGQDPGRFPGGRDHDFGRVAHGVICKHAFRIVNTGDAPLEIIKVRNAMGAVRAEASQYRLPPKAEGTIAVTCDTRRFVGSRTVSIFVAMRTGNGPPEDFVFTVTCHSDDALKIDPKILLQERLMAAACKGVNVARDGFPPSPGVYLGDEKTPDIVTVLKEGAKVNQPDQKGKTALMYASTCGLVENVKTLLAHGADATVKDDDGWTALSHAEADHHWRVEGRREVAKILKEHLAKKR